MWLKKQQLEPYMGQLTGSKSGKKHIKAVYHHPIYLTSTSCEYIMWNDGLDEAQSGIKLARRNTNKLRYGNDTTLTTESEEELESLLMKVKQESEKAGLKLNIQKTKVMAPGPITSWQIEEEKVKTATDFLFLGFKTTADGDCSREIKRRFLLGKKAMTAY